MSDIDRLLERLERVIVMALNSAERGGEAAVSEDTFGPNKVFTARIETRVRFLDELGTRPTADLRVNREPVIDVLDDGEDLKILVHLPGVKREDIVLLTRRGSLRLEITMDGVKFTRDIRCGANLTNARIKSAVENNSIVEITLRKGTRGKSK